jgi:RNA polymerase sigma factor (sigma-70 family)
MEPWEGPLRSGDIETAWNTFIGRYRRLIIATIRRTLDTAEDLPEVFADVCAALSADGMRVLDQYNARADGRARFSTWLVVVVRNQTIDWIRRRSRRRRLTPPQSLSPVQQEIFRHVFMDRRSHTETYELLVGGPAAGMSFGSFLRELAETYRRVEQSSARGVVRYLDPPPSIGVQPAPHPEEVMLSTDARDRLEREMASLSDEERLAILLFVVHELPATDVARTVGWRHAKDVYNRVYRALEKLRRALERQDIRAGDL